MPKLLEACLFCHERVVFVPPIIPWNIAECAASINITSKREAEGRQKHRKKTKNATMSLITLLMGFYFSYFPLSHIKMCTQYSDQQQCRLHARLNANHVDLLQWIMLMLRFYVFYSDIHRFSQWFILVLFVCRTLFSSPFG